MALVIQQTLPYSPSALQLTEPTRWTGLLSLIRPSIKTIQTSNHHPILLDTSLLAGDEIPLAVICSGVANFPSEILRSGIVAALSFNVSEVSAEEVYAALQKENASGADGGAVIVKSSPLLGESGRVEVRKEGRMVLVDVSGALGLDHVFSLLSTTNAATRCDIEKLQELLQQFACSVASTESVVHEQKIGNAPSIVHAAGIAEFNSAKAAIDRDLSHLLSLNSAKVDDAVYSLHFADVNGLSRLEVNIMIHEIAEYFARKTLPVRITQSTILNDQSLARGWAISLSAIASAHLTAHVKPSNTLSNKSQESAPQNSSETRTSKLSFSDPLIRKIITRGCESVIAAEPTITEYDTIVGDGDCGYTLRDGAKQVLSFIQAADLSSLPQTLTALVDDLERAGAESRGGVVGGPGAGGSAGASAAVYARETGGSDVFGLLDSVCGELGGAGGGGGVGEGEGGGGEYEEIGG
ncbi:hypothetical protein BP6252_04278 [Coleophoma cylindrospora]|uniref:DhaL domain-containing protein n=1 Tax=Coleophoma cylindrospora TaxID=1849047 RepID=A0A3D8S0I8_9HELO|nr:hypothetical protein BP6252_04278 [Coleophoma cylindrospora]